MTVTSCRQAFALEQLACAAAGAVMPFTGQFAREATVGPLVIADLQGDRLFSFIVAPVPIPAPPHGHHQDALMRLPAPDDVELVTAIAGRS